MSGAVTAKEGVDIANVAKATATFSNGVADALAKLAASGAITTDLTDLLADDATVTITINDAGTLTAAAADLKAIGGATSGAVNIANAAEIDGTAADVTAALVDAGLPGPRLLRLRGSVPFGAACADRPGVACCFGPARLSPHGPRHAPLGICCGCG